MKKTKINDIRNIGIIALIPAGPIKLVKSMMVKP